MIILVIPIVSRSKRKWYKPQNGKKFTLNLQYKPIQILTNDVQMFLLCFSYFITTVTLMPGVTHKQNLRFFVHKKRPKTKGLLPSKVLISDDGTFIPLGHLVSNLALIYIGSYYITYLLK